MIPEFLAGVKKRAVRPAHKLCDCFVRADVQTKTVSASAMFGVAMKLVSNFAATSVRRVLHRLRHNQPTILYCRQLLGALHTVLQSNQPATFLVT